jgi:hypothetical protein
MRVRGFYEWSSEKKTLSLYRFRNTRWIRVRWWSHIGWSWLFPRMPGFEQDLIGFTADKDDPISVVSAFSLEQNPIHEQKR